MSQALTTQLLDAITLPDLDPASGTASAIKAGGGPSPVAITPATAASSVTLSSSAAASPSSASPISSQAAQVSLGGGAARMMMAELRNKTQMSNPETVVSCVTQCTTD